MKKLQTLTLLVFLLISLSGCTQAKIKYEIDEKYNVSLQYTANIDLTDLDEELKNGVIDLVRKITQDYGRRGFINNTVYNENNIELDLSLTKKNDSLDSAYDTLKALMTDPEISYLLSVDMNTVSKEYQSAFLLEYETDLPLILKSTGIDDLPPTIKNPIVEKLKSSQIAIEIVLPTTEIVEVSETVNITNLNNKTIFSSNVLHDSPTEFKLISKFSLDKGKFVLTDMTTSISNSEQQQSLFQNLIYVGGLFILLTLVGLIVYIYRNKNRYY